MAARRGPCGISAPAHARYLRASSSSRTTRAQADHGLEQDGGSSAKTTARARAGALAPTPSGVNDAQPRIRAARPRGARRGGQVRTRRNVLGTDRTGLVGTGMCHVPSVSAPRRSGKEAGKEGKWREEAPRATGAALCTEGMVALIGQQGLRKRKVCIRGDQFTWTVDGSTPVDNFDRHDRKRGWTVHPIGAGVAENP